MKRTSTTKKKRKTRTRTTGSSRLARFAGALLLSVLLPLGAAAEKKKEPEPTALIAGTVFRDPGFAFPGVQVRLEPAEKHKKAKKQQVVTNTRGEFALRVPPVPLKYVLYVQHTGFAPQQKEIAVQGEDQMVDLVFRLEPEKK
jgi:hypothetical protein